MRRILIFAVAISACAGPGDDASSGVGRLSASLSSVAGAQGMGRQLGVKEIIVTIDKVTAHSTSAGWVQLSPGDVRVDILKLADSAVALGFQNIPAGKVTQLRLYVKEGGEQYVTRDDNVRVDLKVPSGIESGIKLHGMFDVAGCQLTNVPLQLDGKKSIWVHDTGQETLWILRPVIRTGHIDATGMPCVPPTGGAGGSGSGGGPGDSGGGGGPPGSGGGLSGAGGGGPNEGPGGTGGTPPPPGMGGEGTVCTIGSNCLSGACIQGICQRGGADAPCNTNNDCLSGTCVAGACGPGSAVGTGAPCTVNNQCLSGACVNGACDPGGQGKPCLRTTDCLGSFTCTAGYCQPQIN